jgi:hypothetical protein
VWEKRGGDEERNSVQASGKKLTKSNPYKGYTGLFSQVEDGIVKKNGYFQRSTVYFRGKVEWCEKLT